MLSASSAHLNYHDLDNVLNQPETEHNWAAKENAIKALSSACHPSIAQNLEFLSFIKNHRKAFTDSLLTERTRLSGTACELVEKLSTSMGRDFGLHFSELFTGTLLKVCARTNKVMVSRAMKALNSIINAGCLAPLPKACQTFATNNKVLRIACIGLIASCIAQYSSQELEPFLAVFEPVLKEGVSDAAPEVRDTSRKSYKVYAEKFPEQSQRLTAILPGNVLKYLMPDARPTLSQSRVAATPVRSAAGLGRPAETGELGRHQSSRELSTGLSRTGPSRVGSVRARMMAVADHGPSNAFKVPVAANQYGSQSSQPYSYHGAQHQQPQASQTYAPQQHQSLSRNNGPASRTGSIADSSESSGHGIHRVPSQRGRALSGNASSSGSLMHRSPSINLATNGGPQRVAPPTPYNADASKPVRPSTLMNRLSKVEPVSKAGRISSLSSHPSHANPVNHGASMEREQVSASERAKAYSANLKSEMANRRSGDQPMRAGLGARRVATDHAGYSGFGLSPTSMSVSSNTSTASTSAATSTTSVSPTSSLSTSPTMQSPNHDQLFSTFRASSSSQLASSPPESCPSPDARHSTPPMSQQSDDLNPAVSAPPSPRAFAEVSLDADSHSLHLQQQYKQYHQLQQGPDGNTFEPAPLSPHSPPHPRLSNSYPLSLLPLGNAEQMNPQHGPPSPLQEAAKTERSDFDDLDSYVDEDSDHSMSIPDHESLFGNTESYLQIEQEILELQQSLKKQGRSGLDKKEEEELAEEEEEEKSVFMDEDPQLMEQDQEQMAVKAYAEEYEATLAAASCSSTSLPLSHVDE